MKRLWCGVLVAVVVLVCLAPALVVGLGGLAPSELAPSELPLSELALPELRAEPGSPDGFTLAALREAVTDPRLLGLLWRSVRVAGGATLLALLWGVGVGYAAWRLGGWRGALVETLACVPLLVPSLVLALGWVALLGPSGIATGWLRARLGLDSAPFDLYTPAGAAFVLSLAYFPCVAILVAQGLRTLDLGALRAARLWAGPWRAFWHVTRPLLAPHVATGALLTFLLAFADFGVPSVLMVNVYPIEVFTRFSAFQDAGSALASAAPLALVAAALVLLRPRFARPVPATRTSAAARPEGTPWRTGLVLAALGLGLSVVVPLALLLATARGAYAEALRVAGEQMLTSLTVASCGMLLLVALGLVFALAQRGLGARGRGLAEAGVLATLLVPGAAVGIGIVRLVTDGVWPFAAVYPSVWIVAYACAARFVAFPALVLAAAVNRLRPELGSAAAVHGARPLAIAARIALPLLAPALVAAATLSFVASLGELSASVLVDPPGAMTLPVRLASLLHFGKDSLVAALCVMLVALVLVVLLLGTLLAGRPVRLRLSHAHRAS